MNNTKQRSKTLRLTQLALLAAITILLTLTPLGYLKAGAVEITFLTIPVILGAVILGPVDGMILGAIFGLSSFARCFGMDAFGTVLAQANVYYTFILCMIPRILIGLIAGLTAKGLRKVTSIKTRVNVFKYGISSFVGTLVNTVLFLLLLILFFGSNDAVVSKFGDLLALAIAIATFNGLIELAVCTVLGAFIIQGVMHAKKKMRI